MEDTFCGRSITKPPAFCLISLNWSMVTSWNLYKKSIKMICVVENQKKTYLATTQCLDVLQVYNDLASKDKAEARQPSIRRELL